MLSRETIEMYRRMTVGERLKLTLEAIDENTPYLLHGPPDVVDRRFELIRRENDLRNFNMLTAIARTRTAEYPLEMQPEGDTASSHDRE
ncbi:MAG: hypothetical protein DCC68_07865 [Planctomycetota bacterium]|nr:MAG: hypothetical protein DCC68_07865 [Planctomycetota bacterium]